MLVHDNVLFNIVLGKVHTSHYLYSLFLSFPSSLPLPPHLTDVEATTWITGIIS